MSHYIRTIHTSFTSAPSSSSTWALSSPYASSSRSAHPNILLNLGGAANKYPPGLGYNDWRTPSGSSLPGGTTPYTKRRSTTNLRAPTSRRPAPPVPSRTQPASITSMKFDPFSDENSYSYSSTPNTSNAPHYDPNPVLYRTPRARPASIPYTIHIPAASTEAAPAPLPGDDREARSRLVAGILLNRVHAVGKPMRRRSEPKVYVKSGLSRVVSVET